VIFHRTFTGTELVMATHNPGKVRELGDLLAPLGVRAISAGEIGLPEPVEDGDTFKANARIKALSAVAGSGLASLADDSGLVVHGLNGAPGIFSARWADAAGGFNTAMERVDRELNASGTSDRTGHFIAALALAWPDGHVEIFEGRVDGTLVWPARGAHGFGYDPMFVADGYDVTFGEMDSAKKHAISHRADAFAKMLVGCFRAGE
jgi:XTP/dITP diphosphohydrolase